VRVQEADMQASGGLLRSAGDYACSRPCSTTGGDRSPARRAELRKLTQCVARRRALTAIAGAIGRGGRFLKWVASMNGGGAQARLREALTPRGRSTRNRWSPAAQSVLTRDCVSTELGEIHFARRTSFLSTRDENLDPTGDDAVRRSTSSRRALTSPPARCSRPDRSPASSPSRRTERPAVCRLAAA